MHLLSTYMSGGHLFLFTTHITRNKEIAIAAVVVVAIAAVAFWFMRRRSSRA
jgi:hypothetical protein